MSELDKLENYLRLRNASYKRLDENGEWGMHQLIVYSENGARIWDAVCHKGSYGYRQGLLEIMGVIVPENVGDSVEGWLTAKDVIERIERWEERDARLD